MGQRTQTLLDAASAGLLLLWAALALAALAFPAVGPRAADMAAWAAFVAAMLLSGLPRWLLGVSDGELIGPLRLWIAAGTTALLFCLASSIVVAPRVEELRGRLESQDMPPGRFDALKKTHAKAKGLSTQFLCIRIALAVGLAVGARRLPKAAARQIGYNGS